MSKLMGPPSAVKYDPKDSLLRSTSFVVLESKKVSMMRRVMRSHKRILTPSINNPEKLLDKFNAAQDKSVVIAELQESLASLAEISFSTFKAASVSSFRVERYQQATEDCQRCTEGYFMSQITITNPWGWLLTIVEGEPPGPNQMAPMIRPCQYGINNIYNIFGHLDKDPVEVGMHAVDGSRIAIWRFGLSKQSTQRPDEDWAMEKELNVEVSECEYGSELFA